MEGELILVLQILNMEISIRAGKATTENFLVN